MTATPEQAAALGSAAAPRRPIPIVLVTGFLGSGKTTLLQHALTAADAGETAVLVNEFGSVGLDHHLLWNASETCLVLENGCICCTVSDGFLATLEDLFWQRLHRTIPRFGRVVIETTGLADAGAIEANLSGSSLVAERYALALTVCAVDAGRGMAILDDYAEARAQVRAADRLVLTKIDIASPAGIGLLTQRLAALNPSAEIVHAAHGELATTSTAGLLGPAGPLRREHPDEHGDGGHAHSHTADVESFTLRCGAMLDRAALEQALQALADEFGDRLLRVKGLVRVAGEPMPLVVQIAGADVARLEPAPRAVPEVAGDLTVIGRDLGECEVAAVFARCGLLAARGEP